jgi:hypothetical protein
MKSKLPMMLAGAIALTLASSIASAADFEHRIRRRHCRYRCR